MTKRGRPPAIAVEGQTKTCTKCEQDLPLDAYYPRKDGKYGVASWCKQCHSKITLPHKLRWQKEHPDKSQEHIRKWRTSHPEKVRAYKKATFQRWYANLKQDPERYEQHLEKQREKDAAQRARKRQQVSA